MLPFSLKRERLFQAKKINVILKLSSVILSHILVEIDRCFGGCYFIIIRQSEYMRSHGGYIV
jgi:hypothetical protein